MAKYELSKYTLHDLRVSINGADCGYSKCAVCPDQAECDTAGHCIGYAQRQQGHAAFMTAMEAKLAVDRPRHLLGEPLVKINKEEEGALNPHLADRIERIRTGMRAERAQGKPRVYQDGCKLYWWSGINGTPRYHTSTRDLIFGGLPAYIIRSEYSGHPYGMEAWTELHEPSGEYRTYPNVEVCRRLCNTALIEPTLAEQAPVDTPDDYRTKQGDTQRRAGTLLLLPDSDFLVCLPPDHFVRARQSGDGAYTAYIIEGPWLPVWPDRSVMPEYINIRVTSKRTAGDGAFDTGDTMYTAQFQTSDGRCSKQSWDVTAYMQARGNHDRVHAS